MDNTAALVPKVDIGLLQEDLQKLERKVKRGEVIQLSPEKEAGPFLLYIMGDSLDTIATKTSYPVDIIRITAIYYRWPDKAKAITDMAVDNGEQGDPAMKKVQKDLVNQILIATYMSMQKELGDVIAGRKKARQCRLIPNNVHSLEKLITMADTLNSPPEQKIKTDTLIQGQNVQVIQDKRPPEDDTIKIKPQEDEEKKQMLEIVDDE